MNPDTEQYGPDNCENVYEEIIETEMDHVTCAAEPQESDYAEPYQFWPPRRCPPTEEGWLKIYLIG